jgi:hypothetical protein
VLDPLQILFNFGEVSKFIWAAITEYCGLNISFINKRNLFFSSSEVQDQHIGAC